MLTRLTEWLVTPRRMFVAVAGSVLAVIITVVNLTTPHAPTRPAAEVERHAARSTSGAVSSAPAPTAPAKVSSAPTPTSAPSSDNDHETNIRQVHRQALRTTGAYLAAFLDRSSSDRAWRARLDALSTSALARLNREVPRASVPAARVRSLRMVTASYSYALVTARLSGGIELRVALVLDVDGWRVTAVDPAPPTPGANG